MLNYFDKNYSAQLKGVERKKYLSKQRIIRCLFLHGVSTCNDIAHRIKPSNPSVQANLNELMSGGVVEDKGQGDSTGGRRPNKYGLRGDSFFVLCIDVGRFQVRLAILDSNMNNLTGIVSHDIKFQDDFTYLDRIIEYAEKLLADSQIDREKLIGVGMDMPGAIDARKGINYSYLYDPEEALVDIIGKRLSCPVYLENDANVLAMAEYWHGHARGKKNAIVLLHSWGIGLGLIINGTIYRGSRGFAGEFSHIPAVTNGKLCWCNKQGCLETVASATALSILAREGMKNGSESSIFGAMDLQKENVDPAIIINAANQGDQFAIKILYEVGYELGKGISALVQILNPEIIVLGGRMAHAKQYTIAPIQNALNSFCNPLLIQDLKIETAKLGQEASVLGSAIMVMEGLLSRND